MTAAPGARAPNPIRVEAGRLRIEDRDAAEVAAEVGTPLFIASEARIRANYRRLRAAFAAQWPGELNVLYAIKANFALAIRRILTTEGAGGDAFGLGELWATLETGTDPAQVSLGGSGKSAAAIDLAVKSGCRITVDALDELPMIEDAAARHGRRVAVSLRAKPRLDELNAFLAVGSPYREGRSIPLGEWVWDNKWGLTPEEGVEAVHVVRTRPGLDLRGVHAHVGRHYGFQGQYGAQVPGLVRWIAAVRDATGWSPRSLDLGGGWTHRSDPILRGPASTTSKGGHPEWWDAPRGSIESVAELTVSTLRAELAAAAIDTVTTLELEPGRYLVSDAVVLVASVTSVKHQPGIARYVNVDASVAHFPLPELQDAAHRVVVVDRAEAAPEVGPDPVAIVGPSCFEDLLAWDRPLPAMAVGDKIAWFDVGACADAYAATTNAIPRPPLVLVDGARAEVVKRRETVDDVFGRDTLPDRLR